jgi:23S rRNA pseudouridine1911/1915/1917 synthase
MASVGDGEHVVSAGPLPLDRALRGFYDGASWSEVRRAIRTGKVQVDDVVVREATHPVQSGSIIRVSMAAPQYPAATLDPAAIVHVDRHVVVAEKPPALLSVADERHRRGTLVQVLSKRFAPRGPGLRVVQRLDTDTTGLIVFCRTEEAQEHLKEQFASRTVGRHYLAIVSGRARSTTYRSHLIEHKNGKRASTRHKHLGKFACTHVEVLEHLEGATLVSCRLETGRTHQIRIQLSEDGHPLLGDARYARRAVVTPPAPRVMLHAASLSFELPGGERLSFESPMPEDMQRVLEGLR